MTTRIHGLETDEINFAQYPSAFQRFWAIFAFYPPGARVNRDKAYGY
jgi:hypothetical protein